MKLHASITSMLALATLALLSASGQAATNYYHVSVSTGSLIGNSSGPFSLDFQLNGGGALSNTATVSNFDFGGGSADPSAFTFGLASGSIASSVSLTANNSSAFNELYQAFTPGSLLQFDVSLTNNINTPTPDIFAFAILDSLLQNIPTNGLGDSLVLVEVSSPAPIGQAFTSGSVTAAVPEPATMLAGLALIGACGLARRRSA